MGAKEIDASVGMKEVKSDETFHIPVVDFGEFLNPSGSGDRNATANEIVRAFKEVGYVPPQPDESVLLRSVTMKIRLPQEPWHWSRRRRPRVSEGEACSGPLDGCITKKIGLRVRNSSSFLWRRR